jgi:hypothetical protein
MDTKYKFLLKDMHQIYKINTFRTLLLFLCTMIHLKNLMILILLKYCTLDYKTFPYYQLHKKNLGFAMLRTTSDDMEYGMWNVEHGIWGDVWT